MENRETNCADIQDYLDDFWDTLTEEEKAIALGEGYKQPNRCEVIVVDFVTGLGEIQRYTV